MSAISHSLESLFFGLYATAWRVARPLLRRHRRLSDSFAMRLVPNNWSSRADIWMQAASGGEAYLAWEWLKALPIFEDSHNISAWYINKDKPCHILLTSCTRQGLDILEQAAQWAQEQCTLRGIEYFTVSVQVFPLDEPAMMQRAVKLVSPRLVILLETELWPSLMRACRRANVPLMVLNGRMSAKSFGAYFILQSLWKGMAPRFIVAISPDDAMRFSMLFDVPAKVVQNIKFDRVGAENCLETSNAHVASLLPKESKVVLFASVREEEEPMLVSGLCQLVQKLEHEGLDYSLVVAPRHMHRVAAWQDHLHRVGVSTVLRSKLEYSGLTNQEAVQGLQQGRRNKKPVIIWDTFGELDVLYGLVHAVFVGGSLMPLGGQNFLEPLAKGLVPCVGPYLSNFAWVDTESLVEADLLHIVRTDSELAEALYMSLALEAQKGHGLEDEGKEQGLLYKEAVQIRFKAWLAPRRGGAKASVHMVMDILKKNGHGCIENVGKNRA